MYRHHIPKSDLSAASLAISAGLELKNLGVVAVATMSKFFSERQSRLANWRGLGIRFWNVMSIARSRLQTSANSPVFYRPFHCHR